MWNGGNWCNRWWIIFFYFATNDFHFKCAKLSIIWTLIKTKSDSKVMIKRKVASRNGKDPRAYIVTARSTHPPLSRLIFASEFTIRKMMVVHVNNQLSYLSPQTKYLQGWQTVKKSDEDSLYIKDVFSAHEVRLLLIMWDPLFPFIWTLYLAYVHKLKRIFVTKIGDESWLRCIPRSG